MLTAENVKLLNDLAAEVGKGHLSAAEATKVAREMFDKINVTDDDNLTAWRICNDSPYRLDGIPAARCAATNEHIHAAVLEGIKHGRAAAAAKGDAEERFDKVHAVLMAHERVIITDNSARRLTRDILAALDQ